MRNQHTDRYGGVLTSLMMYLGLDREAFARSFGEHAEGVFGEGASLIGEPRVEDGNVTFWVAPTRESGLVYSCYSVASRPSEWFVKA